MHKLFLGYLLLSCKYIFFVLVTLSFVNCAGIPRKVFRQTTVVDPDADAPIAATAISLATKKQAIADVRNHFRHSYKIHTDNKLIYNNYPSAPNAWLYYPRTVLDYSLHRDGQSRLLQGVEQVAADGNRVFVKEDTKKLYFSLPIPDYDGDPSFFARSDPSYPLDKQTYYFEGYRATKNMINLTRLYKDILFVLMYPKIWYQLEPQIDAKSIAVGIVKDFEGLIPQYGGHSRGPWDNYNAPAGEERNTVTFFAIGPDNKTYWVDEMTYFCDNKFQKISSGDHECKGKGFLETFFFGIQPDSSSTQHAMYIASSYDNHYAQWRYSWLINLSRQYGKSFRRDFFWEPAFSDNVYITATRENLIAIDNGEMYSINWTYGSADFSWYARPLPVDVDISKGALINRGCEIDVDTTSGIHYTTFLAPNGTYQEISSPGKPYFTHGWIKR